MKIVIVLANGEFKELWVEDTTYTDDHHPTTQVMDINTYTAAAIGKATQDLELAYP